MTNDLQVFDCVWSAAMWRVAEWMLGDLDRVLRSHGIRVFMTYGTLLGAIRHQGVIPWDDDIDVGIFGDDESRLLHARDDLLNQGYQLKQHRLPWGDSVLKYYKVWIASRPSSTAYFYSWPFVDIWVFRPTGGFNQVTDGDLCCQRSDILPLKPYLFGNLLLHGPVRDDFLVKAYGAGYLDTCVSSSLNHREEKKLISVSASRDHVQSHGYFVQIHTRDSVNDRSKITQNGIYQLKRSNSINELVSQAGHVVCITSTAAELWDLSDGTRTIRDSLEQLSASFSIPVIDLVTDVYSTIHTLRGHGLIRTS